MSSQNNDTFNEVKEIGIDAYLARQQDKSLLRMLTCGSVDDGKSTLIGRLLHDSHQIYEDQLAALHKDNEKVGNAGEDLDLALLVDGLQAEREQGITIDVAYRYFSTAKRKFIIADTPGHEQYTRNMVTGASTSDVAIILVDARYGVQVQTKRHSFICDSLGIKQFVVAVNKMDLMDDPKALLPEMEGLHALHDFAGVFPISALRQKNLDVLETFVRRNLPEGHHLFPEGQITNRTERFLAAELIREKIIRQLGDELPHTTAVEIEGFQPDERGTQHISAIIFVERDGQKRIVIGTGGSRLRSIGTEARRDMEKAFDSKVMLKLWVKVKSGWSDDVRALQSLGLEGES